MINKMRIFQMIKMINPIQKKRLIRKKYLNKKINPKTSINNIKLEV